MDVERQLKPSIRNMYGDAQTRDKISAKRAKFVTACNEFRFVTNRNESLSKPEERRSVLFSKKRRKVALQGML